MCICVYIYMHAYMYALRLYYVCSMHECMHYVYRAYVCIMYVCMALCMHVYMYIYACMLVSFVLLHSSVFFLFDCLFYIILLISACHFLCLINYFFIIPHSIHFLPFLLLIPRRTLLPIYLAVHFSVLLCLSVSNILSVLSLSSRGLSPALHPLQSEIAL